MKIVRNVVAFVITILLCCLAFVSCTNDKNTKESQQANHSNPFDAVNIEEYRISDDIEYKKTDTEIAVENFVSKYDAVSFDDLSDMNLFSAEILDNYSDDLISVTYAELKDVFYENGKLYMCAEDWFDDRLYVLEISKEQYTEIKQFDRDTFGYDIHFVFSITDIQTTYPGTYLYNNFETSYDEENYDYDYEIIYEVTSVKGILVDIIQTK